MYVDTRPLKGVIQWRRAAFTISFRASGHIEEVLVESAVFHLGVEPVERQIVELPLRQTAGAFAMFTGFLLLSCRPELHGSRKEPSLPGDKQVVSNGICVLAENAFREVV
jgi:hypothetical protein